jgi:cytochrome c553
MKKALLATLLTVFTMVIALAIYLYFAIPRARPAAIIEVPQSAELIERGRYLAENVVLCANCHSHRDWGRFGGPAIPPLGSGRPCIEGGSKSVGVSSSDGISSLERSIPGMVFSSGNKFPGLLCIRNLTPDPEAGIGDWTDGEIIRAIREGIGRDGHGLFPLMPYYIYKGIADDDVQALVAYMRSLAPVKAETPRSEIDFPLNMVSQLWPEPLQRKVSMPDTANTQWYGAYLATIGRCKFCHTPSRWGQGRESAPGKAFSGGVAFPMGPEVIYSTNLTPHETGLKSWSREYFIKKFKSYEAYKSYKEVPRVGVQDNTRMDWSAYSGMTEDDLGAIYDYLRTLKPIENQIP